MSFSPAITAEQLHTRLEQLKAANRTPADEGICLVDLRSPEAYAQGHIPGAINASALLLNRSEPPIGGLMPEPAAVNHFLKNIGARIGDQIVAYDGGLETPAARLVWVMDAYGYEACSWLSGGYRAWTHHCYAASTDIETPLTGNLSLSFIGDNVVSVDALVKQLDSGAPQILDVRSAGEYAGTDVRAAHPGHVPGARHAEWTTMLDEHGQLLDEQQLEQQIHSLGISNDEPVIVYCQTHQRSAVTYVALKHLGFQSVKAIDGAWSAWGNREDTPKQLA